MALNTLGLHFVFVNVLLVFFLIAAPAGYAQNQLTAPEIEQQLDLLVGVNHYPENNSKLQQIVATLTEQSPVETYARAKAYQSLQLAFAEKNDEAALKLIEQTLSLAAVADSAGASAELLAVKADIYLQNKDLDKSNELVEQIKQKLPAVSNSRILYYCHNLIGRVLQDSRQYEAALEHLLQAHAAINHSDNINTQSRRQFLNLHISRVQLFLQNYKAALELLDKTIAESHQHNLTERLPELYLNRAYAARELNGLSEQSVDTFIQAARMGKNQGNKKVELAGYNNAGAGLLLLKDYQQSEHYLTLARDIASSINSHAETAVINFNLGYIKVLRGEYDQGLAEMREAVSRFSQYAPASQVAQIQGLLADAYAVAGRYQLQAETLKEQLRLKDEFFQSEREKVLAELQIKYQAQENALQIKLLLSCRLRS